MGTSLRSAVSRSGCRRRASSRALTTFKARLVTGSVKGSQRMGLQLWWASEGVKARTEACREGNRCGVYSREDQLDAGKAPKCAHCNAAHYTWDAVYVRRVRGTGCGRGTGHGRHHSWTVESGVSLRRFGADLRGFGADLRGFGANLREFHSRLREFGADLREFGAS